MGRERRILGGTEEHVNDESILGRITELSEEELRLEEQLSTDAHSDASHARLRSIEVELDQCWDLLRQRRARKSAGQDPDDAAVRPADVVERYLQ